MPVSVEAVVATDSLSDATGVTERWWRRVGLYAQTMNQMNMFNGKLKDVQGAEPTATAICFTLENGHA